MLILISLSVCHVAHHHFSFFLYKCFADVVLLLYNALYIVEWRCLVRSGPASYRPHITCLHPSLDFLRSEHAHTSYRRTDSATVLKLADQIGGRWHARQNNGGTCDLLLPVVGLGPRWTAKDPHRSWVSDDVPFSCVNLRFKAFTSMSESWEYVHARGLHADRAGRFGVAANERMIRLDFMLTVPSC